jgi:hypothetical protein
MRDRLFTTGATEPRTRARGVRTVTIDSLILGGNKTILSTFLRSRWGFSVRRFLVLRENTAITLLILTVVMMDVVAVNTILNHVDS